MTQVKVIVWTTYSKNVAGNRCDVFEALEKKNEYSSIEYLLAIPVRNASLERIFLLTNVLWIIEKTRFNLETILSITLANQYF